MVDQLAQHIAKTHPNLRGYTRANLFRMKTIIYETYRRQRKVAALLRQLPWTHNLLILGKSRRAEEHDFYLRMATSENHEVVEYALSRAMSPAPVAEYQTKMPDKRLLQAKLHEFYELAESQAEATSPGAIVPQLAA